MRSVGRLACPIAVFVLASAGTPASCVAEPPQPVRLIESGARKSFTEIDGELRSILPPARMRVIAPLGNALGDRILLFSVGLDKAKTRDTVRFEVELQSADGARSLVYRRDVDTPGWREESIDLSGRELSGGRLVFRKSLVDGDRGRVWKSYWGEPVLLPAQPERAPSVVLVSIDTLRADLLAPYGAPAATPALDRLAQAGVAFTETYSPSSWTFPSHYAILRGISTRMLPWFPEKLPAERPVALAEVLRDHGYLTAGFTGGGYVSSTLGFADGFDVYYSFQEASDAVSGCTPDRFDGPETFHRAGQWLRVHRRYPFFLFVHTYDVHDRCGFYMVEGRGRGRDMDPEKRDAIIAHYKTKIEDTDRLVGELVDGLAELELDENTLVIVTSDHGEALWEHGEESHGCEKKPYEELVRVPLILRYPAKLAAGQRIATPASLVAVAPTILELLGLPVPATMKEAFTLPLQARTGEDHPVYEQCGNLLAVRDGRYKHIAARQGEFRPESYDLQNDPFEKNPLPNDSAPAERLQALAARYWTTYVKPSAPGAIPKSVDDATRERLRALGYNGWRGGADAGRVGVRKEE